MDQTSLSVGYYNPSQAQKTVFLWAENDKQGILLKARHIKDENDLIIARIIMSEVGDLIINRPEIEGTEAPHLFEWLHITEYFRVYSRFTC